MGHPRKLLLLSAMVLLQSSSDGVLWPALEFSERPVPASRPETAKIPTGPTTADLLAARNLAVPVHGIAAARLRDTFEEARSGGRTHKAIDIMAPWGTPVVAADDGRIEKISRNRAGGLSLYQVDASGRFVYYYAHLAGYADGLVEGQNVKRGQVVGYVGTTGNAPDSAPHLHFAVQVLTRDGRWWKGEVLNPYPALTRGGEALASSR